MTTVVNDPANGVPLASHHYAMLHDESGIADAVIAARGYRTITDAAELERLGFAPAQRRAPGLLLPLWTTDGKNGTYIYRPDNPRVRENRRKKLPDGTCSQTAVKYEQPQGEPVRVDCPPACRAQLADPSIPLFITEGQKKADALASRRVCAVALTGVWNWKSRNDYGGVTFTNDLDYIAWNDRPVYLVFDSDVTSKTGVRQALERFTEHLKRKGAIVSIIYLPDSRDGHKWGVDDWLVAHPDKSAADLMALAEGPRPESKAAPPTIELLDDTPATMTRPLALIAGRVYVATWGYVRVTTKETKNKQGEIIRHDPPIQTTERRLFVVRDDGVIFGDGGHRPLVEMGVDVQLPEIPPAEKLLSASALKAYAKNYRPAPVELFERVTAVVSRFIDFDRSIAAQSTMAQFVACYCLATWFLPAFHVTGYLWPNGDRGSGKTHLLHVVTELAYGGRVILAGSSFATLRDEADYGFTLAFDDAENLSDPRKTDPDKRTLLLAGNRRGNSVALKEKRGDEWVTRYVDTFSFRLFSAIHLPDNVLASRSIIVPLIRTPDRYRANADPLDYALWPCDRRKLVDDLWLVALAHLPQLPGYETWVNDNARLTGRNLEPWRATLAVAKWLDDQGVAGLWERMERLAVDYQKERPGLEMSDLTGLVIRALGVLIGQQLKADEAGRISGVNGVSGMKGAHEFATKSITDAAKKLAEDEEMDIDPEHVSSRRVGRTLGKMRIKKADQSGGKQRGWAITLADLERWCVSYGYGLSQVVGIDNLEVSSAHIDNATNAVNATNVAEGVAEDESAKSRRRVVFPVDSPLPFPAGSWRRLEDGRIEALLSYAELEEMRRWRDEILS